MQPVPSRVPTIRKLASVFPAGGPAGSKKCKKLRISRAEFKTQPSRLLIAPMEPADHEMYRAAIHGDLEAFELVIRKMSVRFLVCRAAECHSARRTDLEVCVPLLVAGPSCSKHPSIVK